MDCTNLFREAKKAIRSLNITDIDTVNKVLADVANAAVEQCDNIISENKKDLDQMDVNDPRYDRLKLTRPRIEAIAADIRTVAKLPSPLGRVLSETERPNGLKISRLSVPFGVVGVIYEARPNVTFDVFSLCLKSGNVCILKGGSDAINSNTATVKIIRDVLKRHNLNENIITLLPAGREETTQLLNSRDYVDLIIPRGSRGLIDYVRDNSKIPVIETGAGICHTYFDEFGDRETGRKVIFNAKTRRVSVCNALDCVIINENRLDDLFYIVEPCAAADVIIFADEKAYPVLEGKYPSELLKRADTSSFGTEFLSYKMAVKTCSSIEDALDHISEYGSKHSEAIISENKSHMNLFYKAVDASSVYSNTSTAFTDGAEFGLGAEIGISTQKLHARGPMALEALTTYKWIVEGKGQTRV